MKKASVSELKNRLSHFLRFVRAGQPVLVYDRDRPIARIEPVTDPGGADADAWIAELETLGLLRPPSAKLPANWLRERVAVRSDVVSVLLEERETGR